MANYAINIFVVIGGLSVTMMLLSMVILRLTLYYKVISVLPSGNLYKEFSTVFSMRFPNAIVFGLACVFPHVNRSFLIMDYHSGVDIPKVANTFHKAVAYTMVIGCGLLLLCGVFYFFTHWTGLIVWPIDN